MRNFLILSAIVIAFAFGCNDSSGDSKPAILRSDTTTVLCFYKDLYTGRVVYGFTKRIVHDTLMFITIDSTTQVKKWTKDTSYIQTVSVPIDSTRSRILKVPIKDSTGKQNYAAYDVPCQKRFIRSGWDHVDSTLINGLRNQQ